MSNHAAFEQRAKRESSTSARQIGVTPHPRPVGLALVEARRTSSTEPVEIFQAAATGSTSALPYRAELERAFHHDFSGVQVFADRPGEMAALNARAATMGQTVVFADARPGKETVAHELTHVVQNQRGGGLIKETGVSSAFEPEEVNAREVATSVISGGTARVRPPSPGNAGLHLEFSSAFKDICYVDPERQRRADNYRRVTEKGRGSSSPTVGPDPFTPSMRALLKRRDALLQLVQKIDYRTMQAPIRLDVETVLATYLDEDDLRTRVENASFYLPSLLPLSFGESLGEARGARSFSDQTNSTRPPGVQYPRGAK